MSLIARNIKINKNLIRTFTAVVESEYTNEPTYPQPAPYTMEEKWNYKYEEWAKKIQNLPTIEQKCIEMNMPKYYGFNSVILNDNTISPQSLDFVKFATQTFVVPHLPENYYVNEDIIVHKFIESIKPHVENLILLHFNSNIYRKSKNFKRPELKLNKINNENFIVNLNNLVIRFLDKNVEHIKTDSIDLRPRLEGYWRVGGFEPASFIKGKREKFYKLPDEFVDKGVDRHMRSTICPTIAIRTKHGLPQAVPMDTTKIPVLQTHKEDKITIDILDSAEENLMTIPLENVNEGEAKEQQYYEYDSPVDPYKTRPASHALFTRYKRATLVPGFWPGVENEHGHLFIHSREHEKMLSKKYSNHELFLPMLAQCKAVLAGFTQALSYAFYQGFTPFNELTYPVVQQSIFTDGSQWRFGLYQMNTCVFHSENFNENNPRKNILWLTEEEKLFEGIENGKVKNLNENILKNLCRSYLIKGVENEDPHPYLADYKYLMNFDAPFDYKTQFHKEFLDLNSERKRNKNPKPEIFAWERIYKIYFKTRHMDKKTKFFENRWVDNPYTRRLDNYMLRYIPRVRRLTPKIKFYPRLNSEKLFVHDFKTLKPMSLAPDDIHAFKSFNVNWDTPPYFTGKLKWSRRPRILMPKV